MRISQIKTHTTRILIFLLTFVLLNFFLSFQIQNPKLIAQNNSKKLDQQKNFATITQKLEASQHALMARNYEKVIQHTSEVLDIDPQIVLAYTYRGTAFTELQNWKFAIKDFNSAIKIVPKNGRLLYLRAMVYTRTKNYKKALKDLNFSIKYEPSILDSYYDRAVLLMNLKKFDQAMEGFTTVSNIDPSHPAAYMQQGIIHSLQGDYNQALNLYDKAKKLIPHEPFIYFHEGRTYLSLANDTKALEDYEKALSSFNTGLKIQKSSLDLLNGRSLAHYFLDNFSQALEDINHIFEEDSRNAQSHIYRGFIYIGLQNYDLALEEFSHALIFDPNFDIAYHGRAASLLDLGENPHIALKAINKAIKLNKKEAIYYDLRGKIHKKLRNYKKALIDLNKAIQLDSELVSAWYHKSLVYQEIGEISEALKNTQTAKNIFDKRKKNRLYIMNMEKTEKNLKKLLKTLGPAPQPKINKFLFEENLTNPESEKDKK